MSHAAVFILEAESTVGDCGYRFWCELGVSDVLDGSSVFQCCGG